MNALRTLSLFVIPCALAGLVSCGGEEARMAKGFHLPEGDIEKGKAAFQSLKCTMCHTVAGVEFPEIKHGTGFQLGGKVRRIKTYGELVTAVIDPGHDVAPEFAATRDTKEGEQAKTTMPPYNSDMTVRQLGDIVIFLHSRYQEEGPDFPDYPFP